MPALRNGYSASVANLIVFFLSAVLHEFVISLPLGFVRYYAFLGMLGQMPLVAITKWMDKKLRGSAGNVIFWLAFCVVGQPMGVLLYALDYQAMQREGADVGVGAQWWKGMNLGFGKVEL